MKINGLELPSDVAADIDAGGRQLSNDELSRLKEMLGRVESPLPRFFSHEEIERENQLWTSDAAQYYLGQESDSIVPGDADPEKTLIIGQAEPDSPIALDFRTSGPRVIYLGDVDHTPYWIELSSDYNALLHALQKERI